MQTGPSKTITKQDIVGFENELRTLMMKKLDPNVKWNYCTFLPGDDPKAMKDRMQKFIDKELGNFLQSSSDILTNLTQVDADSIGSGKETPNAQQFIKLMKELENKGFNGTRNMPINFWSGNEGRKKAHENPQKEFSDSEVASLAVLFDLCYLVQKFETEALKQNPNFKKTLSSLLPETLSKIYANEAQGNINVYMASDKLSESSGLTASNNFWNAELPTLQSLLHVGKVNSILVHTYDHNNKNWKSPVNINDPEANVLNIVRRTAHPGAGKLPPDSDQERFVQDRTPSEFQDWCNSASPRVPIQLGKLRKCVEKWKQSTLKSKKSDTSEEKALYQEIESLENTMGDIQAKAELTFAQAQEAVKPSVISNLAVSISDDVGSLNTKHVVSAEVRKSVSAKVGQVAYDRAKRKEPPPGTREQISPESSAKKIKKRI